MSPKKNNRFGKYLFEMISIVVGVLVALAVDEWNEDRQNRERAEIAIHNVHLEIGKNLEVLGILHPENKAVLDVLQTKASTDSSMRILPGLQLYDTAWRTLESSGISAFVDYDELFEIAQVYSIQNIYKDLGNDFIDQIMETKTLALAMGRDISEEEIIHSSVELLELMVHVEENLIVLMKEYIAIDATD